MSRAEPSGLAALLRDYLNYAGARLWAALALMLLGAIAESFGLLLLVPLVTFAVGREAADVPGVFRPLLDFAAGLAPDQRLLATLALFIGAMAARSLLVLARDRLLARLLAGYDASLRLRSAATLAQRGWTFASGLGQAGMQSLLLTDVPRATTAVAQGQQFVVSGVMLLVQLAVAAMLSPTLTAVALAIVAAGSLLSIGWTRRGVRRGMALVRRAEESTSSGFRLHAGLKAALAQGTVPQFLAEYRVSLGGDRDEVVRFRDDLALTRSLAFMASALAAALLFYIGERVLQLPFPILFASLVIFARMAAPAQQLQQAAQNIAAHVPSFAAIERRLGKLAPPPAAAAVVEPADWRELRADDVRFEHQPRLGLAGVSLRLGRGEWLGLSGPSGAGKTTLIDLLAGLLAPQSGAVTLDGKPLEGDLLEAWRAAIAYVAQEGSVFDDSVRGNLTSDSRGASEEQLWDALELVGLAERIRGFPRGLDERVGDRGSALSGGERQRLVIARALLRKPSLLLLDEATSALDAKSERALLERIRALQPRPAAVLVAHRDTTLSYCDSVISIPHSKGQKAAE